MALYKRLSKSVIPAATTAKRFMQEDRSTHPGRNPHGDGRYIPILDGWRAVAILLVLSFHGFFNSDVSKHPWLRSVATLSGKTGALGVLIFFAISGYLITGRLLYESRTTGQISLATFYLKRAFRILPPVTVYLLVLILLGAAGVLRLRWGDAAAPVFLTNYIHGSWYTTHFWSLSVEEHFYLFWPLCVVLCGWRRAFWVGIGLIVAVGVWRPWEMRHVRDTAHALQHTDMRLDYIMMGCVAACCVSFYPSARDFLARLGSTAGLVGLLIALLLTTRGWPIDMRSLQAALLTLMVCCSALAEARVPRMLLANRPMLWIGKISYSLYVWQMVFLGPSSHAFWRSPLALPLKIAGALLAAVLSYHLVEKPFIQKGRQVIKVRDRVRAEKLHQAREGA